MESAIQKLIDIVFEIDRPGVAGELTISSGENTIKFNVEGGFLVGSSLKGPGQTLFDFLLLSGRISRSVYEEVLIQSKEENLAPWVALLRNGWITENELNSARCQLAAQRFSFVLSTACSDVRFEATRPLGIQPIIGAQRASLLLLEYLYLALTGGKMEPISVPPYAIIRPTERLKHYLTALQALFVDSLPLPAAGGETYESIESRYGSKTAIYLTILLITGMLRTELEHPSIHAQVDVKIEKLFGLLKKMLIVEAGEIKDDHYLISEMVMETGNLLSSGFYALDFARDYYNRSMKMLKEDSRVAERRFYLDFLAGNIQQILDKDFADRLLALSSSRNVKAAILRNLAFCYFHSGLINEALKYIHEAFIYRPYDFDNLPLFVKLLASTSNYIVNEVGGKEIEIGSFHESSYPQLLSLAIGCARENGESGLVSYIVSKATERTQLSSQMFDESISIMRSSNMGPDLVELITYFVLSFEKKGWTNPLWTLGALFTSDNIEKTQEPAREAYEILLKTSSGKSWAFKKISNLLETVTSPSQLLDILVSCYFAVGDAEQKFMIGEKIVKVFENIRAGEVKSHKKLESLHSALKDRDEKKLDEEIRNFELELGLRTFQHGQIEQIMQLLEKKLASSANKDKARIYSRMATIADMVPEFEGKAHALWDTAAKGNEPSPSALFAAVENSINSSKFEEAADLIEKNVEFLPYSIRPDAMNIIATLRIKSGDIDGFKKIAELIIENFGWYEEVISKLSQQLLTIKDTPGIEGLISKLFRYRVKWNNLDEITAEIGDFILASADNNNQLQDEITESVRNLIDIPFAVKIKGDSKDFALKVFLENAASSFQKWAKHLDSIRCLERILLLEDRISRKLELLTKIANTYLEMGVEGVEGAILTIYRLRRNGADPQILHYFINRLTSSFGINLQDEATIKSLLLRSTTEEEYPWIDAAMGIIYGRICGDVRKGIQYAINGYRRNPQITENGILAGLLCEEMEDWQGAIEIYSEVGEKEKDTASAAKILKRAAMIADFNKKDEKESIRLLMQVLLKNPCDDKLFNELCLKAIKNKDKELFVKVHEAVEGSLPGKESQKAFYYKYAREMDEHFQDPEFSLKMLLKALAISPRRGPVLDYIVQIARRIGKFQPLLEAISILKSAGASREEIGSLIQEAVIAFLEDGNMASAYGIMSECIERDPGIDIVGSVEKLPLYGQSGVAMARGLLDKWITSLESAIVQSPDNQEYIKRIDVLSEMRDILIETSEVEQDTRRTLPPGSVPPSSIDRGWEEIVAGKAPLPEDETTYEMFPNVDIAARKVMGETVFAPPPPVKPPLEEIDRILEDMPKVTVDLDQGEIEALSRIEKMTSVQMDVEQIGEERKVPSEVSGESKRPSKPSFAGAEAKAILDSIGQPDVVETKVVVQTDRGEQGETVQKTLEEEAKEKGEEITRVRKDSISVEVIIEPQGAKIADEGMECKPEEVPIEKESKVSIIEKKSYGLKGDNAISEYLEEPWKLNMIPAILQMHQEEFSTKSAIFVLRGIFSLFNQNNAKFSIKQYKLIGKEKTSKSFTFLVEEKLYREWFEVLELIWNYLPGVAIEKIEDYNVTAVDQITPFSSGPVAPIIERIIRAMGYVRATVFCKRDRKLQVSTVRTNPPSIVVLLPLGKLPESVEYYIAKAAWSAGSKKILPATLPAEEGEKIIEAALGAFGKHIKKEKLDPIVSSIINDAWQVIPHRIQQILRAKMENMEKSDFELLKKIALYESIKAGFLFSGDCFTALREFLPGDMISSIEGDIPAELLEQIIRENEQMREFLRFILSHEVLKFMDDFII